MATDKIKSNEDTEQRLRNLEAQIRLITDALISLAKLIKPEHNNFGLLALIAGFNAQEIEETENIFGRASAQRKITKEEFLKRFNDRLPHRKEMLIAIAEAYKSDGKFPRLCNLVLDE